MSQLFNETGKLISEQTEITGVNKINFKELTWMSTSLLCSRAHQITNAKTHVFSDSVLCVGKMGDDPIATWKANEMVFGKQSLQGFESNRMRDRQCEPEHFKDRIIFMSMYYDIEWREKGNTEICEYNSLTVAEFSRKFARGHWSFLGFGSEKKW